MDLTAALAAWTTLLGDDRVHDDEATLDRVARTTLPDASRPLAVLRPTDAGQVPDVVRTAGAHGVPLYPISRGNNWGYGDACPPTPGQVLLDLSGLDRIVSVDEDLAYAVVEPGVTQGALHAHLEERGLRLVVPTSGSSPDASIVGNALERGWGHSAYGDHFDHVAGIEAVLADGTVVRTGFGHLPDASATHLLRWGVGPSVDGLFSQSNMGIVTRLGIHLLPKPEHATSIVFGSGSDADLEAIIDRLRPLRLSGALPGAVHISSDVRAISYRMRYPYGEAGGRTPLPQDVADRLGEQLNIRAWNLMTVVSGTRGEVRTRSRQVRRALKGLGTARTVSPTILERAEQVARPLAGLGFAPALKTLGTIALARPGLELLLGRPTDFGMKSTAWRLPDDRPDVDGTPLDRGVGLFWLAPVCPATGRDVRRVVELLRSGLGEAGFDALLTITLLNGRAAGVTTALSYDRDDPAEAERARACKDEVLSRLIEAGYPPYRVGIGDMGRLDPEASGYWDMVRRVKDAVDPDGLLAPGRYAPWQAGAPVGAPDQS